MIKKKKHLVQRMPLESCSKQTLRLFPFVMLSFEISVTLGCGASATLPRLGRGGGCVPGWSGVHAWILAHTGFNHKSSDLKCCF